MSTSARYTNNTGVINAGTDNTDRIRNNQALIGIASTSPIAIVPYASNTLVQPVALTGATTITIGVGTSTTAPYVGDVVDFLLVSDGTTRTVTFSTGTLPNGTLAVTTAKTASISFMFNGTAWQETRRTVTA